MPSPTVTIWRPPHALAVGTVSLLIVVPAYEVLTIHSAALLGNASTGAALARASIYSVTTAGSGGTPTTAAFTVHDKVGDALPSGWAVNHGNYTTAPTLGTERMPLMVQPYGGVDEVPIVSGFPLVWHNASGSAIQVAIAGVAGTDSCAIKLLATLGA